MLLALRETAPENASAWKRFVCWVIRARLASRYSHGGIVINGTLYHITASHGAHSLPLEQWSPERWSLFDVGGDDEAALALFSRVMEGPLRGSSVGCGEPSRGTIGSAYWRSSVCLSG